MMNKKISVVVPIFNEEGSICPLFERLSQVSSLTSDYEWDYIFVNDGSTDRSIDVLEELSNSSLKIKVVNFSRNFGKEVALSAGLHYADPNSAAVITIDADLQHPPELIPDMLSAWESGAEMVVTIRTSSLDESFFRRISSLIYYWLINNISNVNITPKSTDFRLYDQKIVLEFMRITERNRMFRGIMDWMGFKRKYINFQASARNYGKSTYSIKHLVKLALGSITSFSLWPLRITGYIGVVITILSFFSLSWIFCNNLFLGWQTFTPLAIVVMVNTFLIGFVLMAIGLVALYIGTIHTEVINRPLYVVSNTRNIKNN